LVGLVMATVGGELVVTVTITGNDGRDPKHAPVCHRSATSRRAVKVSVRTLDQSSPDGAKAELEVEECLRLECPC
jgi:hypothetical protein